jgi:ADP-ribose pyrophosphatase YjhB (NUDIX family)
MSNRPIGPIPAVDIIVEDPAGRILLGRISPRWSAGGQYEWGLPGREIAFGEDLWMAVARNLDAEIGLSLLSARAVSVNSNFALEDHYLTIGVAVTTAGELTNRRPEDWIAWEWWDRDDIPSRLFPAANNTLSSYLGDAISIDLAGRAPAG